MDGGLLAFLRLPKRALQKWTLVESIDDIKRTAKQWADELAELGYKITAVPTPMDQQGVQAYFDYAAKKAAEEQQKKEAAEKTEAEKQEKIRRLDPKPNPPEWYRKLRDSKKYWNGKFYGNNKRGWRVYWTATRPRSARKTRSATSVGAPNSKSGRNFGKTDNTYI